MKSQPRARVADLPSKGYWITFPHVEMRSKQRVNLILDQHGIIFYKGFVHSSIARALGRVFSHQICFKSIDNDPLMIAKTRENRIKNLIGGQKLCSQRTHYKSSHNGPPTTAGERYEPPPECKIFMPQILAFMHLFSTVTF